jgi:tetratricopeptide (TPR) repeat protein
MTVNLILWLHRGGQVAGAAILRELLEKLGCTTRLVVTSRDYPSDAFRADVNLFSSELSPAWTRLAPLNILIPNQEQDVRQSFGRMHPGRFAEIEDQLGYLQLADKLLVKTHHAQEIYAKHGLRSAYIGFTCRDRYLPEVNKEREPWLCVIGDSHFNKDIAPVLRVWQRNPQFPKLLVTLHRVPPPLEPRLLPMPNVEYRREPLDDQELRLLQNRCAVHICPSIMEGWGHAIVESMSTGALLLTTAAPPMDEHVNESRGDTFGFSSRSPHAFGYRFTIDEDSLEQAVRRVLALSQDERKQRGQRAREYFLENDRQFREAFAREWRELTAKPRHTGASPASPFAAEPLPPRNTAGQSPSVRAEISAGELLDKISILRIKRLRINDPAQLENIARELESLEATRDTQLPNTAELRSLCGELEAINASLWQTEDDLRRCEQQRDFGPPFIGFARSVYRLNDRRAALKKRVNALTGSRLVEEKSHPTYDKPGAPNDSIKRLLRRGVQQQRAGDLDAAESCYRGVLELDPRQADALHLMGRLFDQRGLPQRAIDSITAALAIQPNSPEFHNSLGLVHGRQGNHAAAEQCFRKATQHRSAYPEALTNLGIALLHQGAAAAAVEVHQKSIALDGKRAPAHYNLAEALREAGQFAEAATAYERAVALDPGYAEAWNNMGVCHRQLGETERAKGAFESAIKIKDDFAGAHWNHAMVLLFRGEWAAGWEEYEWRWKLPDFAEHAARFPAKLWTGEELAGKTLLLHAEQGLGDTLQFIRYAPLLAERGATVILESQPGLVQLLSRTPSISRVMTRNDPLPPFDFHIPLVSLPLRFATTLQNVPTQVPYLHARKDLTDLWAQRLATADANFRIGLVWQGSAKPDPLRSCPASELTALAGLPRVQFVSLQRDPTEAAPAELRLLDFPEANADMENTAALIANLDLVLSIDTSIAHLAGALGKPVWTMLPHCPDWRWMESRVDSPSATSLFTLHTSPFPDSPPAPSPFTIHPSPFPDSPPSTSPFTIHPSLLLDSPWYPAMRLFRQQRREEWKPLLQRVTGELEKLTWEN